MDKDLVFNFRHRVGSLNWKLVSSLDIDAIIDDQNILELQSVLDNITFCDFSSHDVRNNSIDNVSCLVKVMQLIIEYLLHSQEYQYKLAQSIHNRNSNLKNTIKSMTRDIAGLKEDNVIYQRQLSILRHSLQKAQDMIRDNKIHGPLNLGGNQLVDPASMQSMNMELINTMFDQHRATYMKDIEQMMANSFSHIIKTVQVDNHHNKVDYLGEFRDHIESMLQSSIGAIEQKAIDAINKDHHKTTSTSAADKLNIEQVEAALIARAAELNHREALLIQREDELKRHEVELKSTQEQWQTQQSNQLKELENQRKEAAHIAIGTDPLHNADASTGTEVVTRLSVATSMNAEQMDMMKKRFALGFKLLNYFHWTRSQREVERAFSHWTIYTFNARDVEQAEDYRRQLLTADSIRAKREQDLLNLLQQEKESSIAEQGRYRTQLRKLEEDRRLEREEATASKEELRAKNVQALYAIEESKRQRLDGAKKSRVDSSVMTSMDLSQWPLLSSSSTKLAPSAQTSNMPYYWLLDKQYDGRDESELLATVQEKISSQAKQSMMRVNTSIMDGLNSEINNRLQEML